MNGIYLFFIVIFIIVFFATPDTSHAQNTSIDSLLEIVKQNRANSATYNQLALEHYIININRSKQFASKALSLAREEKDSAQIAYAFNRLGTTCLYQNELDSALVNYRNSATLFGHLKMYNDCAGSTTCCAKVFEYKLQNDSAQKEYAKALDIFEKAGKSEYYVQALIANGKFHSKQGKLNDALGYFNKALENMSHLKDYDQIIFFNTIAKTYQDLGDFRNAIKFLDEAISKSKLGRDDMVLALTYVNVGNLYIAWGKGETALKYYTKSLEISKKAGFGQFLRGIPVLIGDIYLDKKQYDKAKNYYLQTLDYAHQSSGDVINEAKAYHGLSKICTDKHEYNEAIKHSLKALSLSERAKIPLYIANTHYLLAKNYLNFSLLEKAKNHLDTAASIATKDSLKNLEAQITLLYARYYNISNKEPGSSPFYEKYIAIKDSMFTGQNQELFARFQVELDNLEKGYKLKEAENLNKLNVAELSQKKKQIIFISTISLLLLMGIFVYAAMYSQQQQTNRALFIKNEELLKQENERRSNKKAQEGKSTKIPETLQKEVIRKLNEELDKNKIHLRNGLTLHSLSKILGTNSVYLSKIIKTTYNSSFSAFINKHRVMEAQKMILNKNFSNYTIDAISTECGYNSKSTFNKTFKELTGLTPKEFKRQGALQNQ